MAIKTINLVQKVQGTNDSASAQMVTVRDNYSSVPSHNNECGLGGTGEKESKPNNVTYIRFGPDFSSIPAGAVINSATLNWNIVGADWVTRVSGSISPCVNFSSSISGKNKPALVSSSTASSSFYISTCSYSGGYLTNDKGRANGRKVAPQAFNTDITNTVRYLVSNRLNCVRVYVSPGKNRKYLSSTATLTVDYVAAPSYCNLAVTETDCTSNIFMEDQATVTASVPVSNIPEYYRFIVTSGTNVHNTAWTRNPVFTFSGVQLFGSPQTGVTTVQAQASYESNGKTTVSSSVLTISRNTAPSVSSVNISSSQNSLVLKNNKLFASGLVSITSTVTDSSIKRGFNGGAVTKQNGYQISQSGVWGSVLPLPGDTLDLSSMDVQGFLTRAVCTANDGFKTGAGYVEFTACTPPYLSGARVQQGEVTITEDRLPAGSSVTFEVTVKQDQGLNNLIKLTRYKKTGLSGTFISDNVINKTISPTELGVDSFYFNISDTITTPNSVDTYVEYKWVIEATDLVKGFVTQQYVYRVNLNPVPYGVLDARGLNYPDHIITTYTSGGYPIYTYSLLGEFGGQYICYLDNVMLSWSPGQDADEDTLNYIIKNNGVTLQTLAGLSYQHDATGAQGGTREYTLHLNDGYNTINGATKSLSVSSLPSTPTGVLLYEYDFDTLTFIPVTYTQGQVNRINSRLRINWTGVDNNVTPAGAMRHRVEVWVDTGETEVLYKTLTTDLGVTNFEFTLGVDYTPSTSVFIKLYSIDRFDAVCSVPYVSETYQLEPEVTCPQVMGTSGKGCLWNPGMWDDTSILTTTRFKKPIFFATIRNPLQDSALGVQCELFPRLQNGVDVSVTMNTLSTYPKTPGGLKQYFTATSQTYVTKLLIASSDTVPANTNYSYMPYSEQVVSFRLDDASYLTLNTEYYVVLRLQKGVSDEYYYTTLNESAVFSYQDTFNGFTPISLVQGETEIRRIQPESVQWYVNKLYSSYGLPQPAQATLDDKIYGSEDTITVNRPAQGLTDWEVAEPSNYNLCPYPYQVGGYSSYWYNLNGGVTIENKKLVFTGVGSATSLFLPWDYADTDQLWLSMDILVDETIDLTTRKYVDYGIEFFDANKTKITGLTIYVPVLLSDDGSSGKSTIKFSLVDTHELVTGLLQTGIKFVRLTIQTEPAGSSYLLTDFEVENIMVYKGSNDGTYTVKDYIEYSDSNITNVLNFGTGSYNSWVARQSTLLYELVHTHINKKLLASGLSQQEIDDDWITPGSTVSITQVVEDDEITLAEFIETAFTELGIWAYLTRL